MTLFLAAVQLLALLFAPFVVVGVINRTKSLWAGRRGPPVLQLAYDVARLLRKRAVYSTTSTLVFRAMPWVVLASSVASGLDAPFLGCRAPVD
jgi:formate hydrogenlyase subunit 4